MRRLSVLAVTILSTVTSICMGQLELRLKKPDRPLSATDSERLNKVAELVVGFNQTESEELKNGLWYYLKWYDYDEVAGMFQDVFENVWPSTRGKRFNIVFARTNNVTTYANRLHYKDYAFVYYDPWLGVVSTIFDV